MITLDDRSLHVAFCVCVRVCVYVAKCGGTRSTRRALVVALDAHRRRRTFELVRARCGGRRTKGGRRRCRRRRSRQSRG